MYEIEIYNPTTKEEKFIFGHSIPDAFKAYNLSLTEWQVMCVDYID